MGTNLKRVGLLILCTIFASSALACTRPGQTRDINFDFNSSEISNAEVLAVANWIADSHSNTSTLEGLSILGLADRREHTPERMAEDRAEKAKQILEALGVRAEKTEVVARTYKPTMPNSKFEPTGTRVEVTLIPACID